MTPDGVMHASQWAKRRGFIMRLELQAQQFYQEERLAGVVRFRSTAPDGVVVKRIRTSLWALESENSMSQVREELVTERLSLAPLEDCELPFWLPIPRGSVLGPARLLLTVGGGLFQYVSAPSVKLMVVPERRLAEVVGLVAEIAHHEIEGWHLAGAGDGYYVGLKPKPEMADRFMGIRMDLYPSGNGLYGTLLVIPQHPGTFPPWQAVLLPNNGQHRFRLPTPDLDTARREFEPILLPYINDVQKLPIPATLAVALEGLPLPSRDSQA